MPDLTPTNQQAAGFGSGIITSEQPRTSVTAQDVAQPYNALSNALTNAGEALNEVAKGLAKDAGFKAVTTDADGNIQVEKMPILGPASAEYARAVKISALAQGEQAAKRQDIAARAKFHDDPESYLAWGEAFKQEKVKQFTQAAGPEVGIAIGQTIDATTTTTYRGLLNEHERLTLQRADNEIKTGIADSQNNLMAMARGGITAGPEWDQNIQKFVTLTNERVSNPRLAYPQAMADFDIRNLHGELGGQGAIYHTLSVYSDKSVGEDGMPNGGQAKAIEYAKRILTDPDLKLTMAQRLSFHGQALAEIRTQETLRRGAMDDLRIKHLEINDAIAGGGRDPALAQRINDLIERAKSMNNRSMVASLSSEYAKKGFYDAFGDQSLEDRSKQISTARTGGAIATSPAEMNLIKHESSGNPTLVNRLGYAGLYQFGAPLLKDLGIYKPGAGENLQTWSKTGKGEPGKWSGEFSVPGFPEVKTLKDFLANPAAQKATFDKHIEGMDAAIIANGMDRFLGQKVGGVTISREGLHAMIHLGGVKGALQTLASNGAINPRDENGTSLLDYARSGSRMMTDANPGMSMWLLANRSRQLSSDARDEWGKIKTAWTDSGGVPSPARVDQITNAMRAGGDFDGLDMVTHDQYLFDAVQQGAQLSDTERNAFITDYRRRGAAGEIDRPENSDVFKGLVRVDEKIRTGLAKNPISTTVTRFSKYFSTPAPLDLANPDNMAAGLRVRGEIARFASDKEGVPVSAFDEAELHQVQAVLDTPNVAVKGAIFGAIATLPEKVRNATLAKIGEKRPDFMVSAAAGSMMRQAPDIAQSVLRGQEAIKADKGYLPVVEGKVTGDFIQDLDKALPAATFSLAARTTDNGPYEVARGMIKARYADLSAQVGDTTGKLNSTRLKTAVDDVTGGVLVHNGGTFIAPLRGMPQRNFDNVIGAITENDLAGVTTLNGQPVTPFYLQHTAQLESIGDGRYMVRLGKDPLRPVYAYQGANTETPQKFILDLRNRPLAARQPIAGLTEAATAFMGGPVP